MGQVILGILLFALVTAVLYVWGLKKSISQKEDLDRALLQKSAEQVLHYLKEHDTIDRAEMARQVEGVRAGLFWSRSRVSVRDGRSFVPGLIVYMTERQMLEEVSHGRYRRKPEKAD